MWGESGGGTKSFENPKIIVRNVDNRKYIATTKKPYQGRPSKQHFGRRTLKLYPAVFSRCSLEAATLRRDSVSELNR